MVHSDTRGAILVFAIEQKLFRERNRTIGLYLARGIVILVVINLDMGLSSLI